MNFVFIIVVINDRCYVTVAFEFSNGLINFLNFLAVDFTIRTSQIMFRLSVFLESKENSKRKTKLTLTSIFVMHLDRIGIIKMRDG